MKIGFDFDGVITDPFPLKARYARELFGVTLKPECAKEFHVVEQGLLTREQYRDIALHIQNDRATLTLPAIAGALHVLSTLTAAGHELAIITSRNVEEAQIAEEWCRGHNVEMPIISVGYGTLKSEALRGFDSYIDDDYEKLVPLVEIVPQLFLLTAPHNAEVRPDARITRVDSWDEFYTHLTKQYVRN